MCEAKVYVSREGKLEEIMENVVTVKPQGESLVLTDIFGEEKLIKAFLKEVRLLDHKILLEEAEE